MYPQRELTRLAAYKAALRRDIGLRRTQCAEASACVTRPLEWLDRAVAFWRRLSPMAQFAVVPLGFLVRRAVFPRPGFLGAIVRWGPLVFRALRGIKSAVAPGNAASR